MRIYLNRIIGFQIIAWMGAASAALKGAVTLDDATAWWRFDKPTAAAIGSAVQTSQIQDHLGRYAATAVSGDIQWTTVDQPSMSAFGSSGTGLSFNPRVETLNSGSTVPDQIRSSLLEMNHAGLAVRGSSTVFTRILWDGAIPGSDDGPLNNQYWLLRNGYSGAGQGFLFGLRSADANADRAVLQYFTYQGAGGLSHTVSTFTLERGVWYDIALVMNDGGELSTYADNSVTFYAQSVEYGWQKSEHLGMYLSGNPTNNVYLGSEDRGSSSTGNQRKSFDGSLDYLAMFNQALGESEVKALMVPEPSQTLMLMAAMFWFFRGHRTRR